MLINKIKNKIDNLTNQHDDTFFYYDQQSLYQQIALLKSTLPDSAELYYSLKANSNDQLINLISKRIHHFDVASLGELLLLINKNIAPKNIHFTGPGKKPSEIKRALELNIGEIVVESREELEFIYHNLSGSLTKVLLRINFSNSGNYFGIAETEICDILKDNKFQNLIVGFHYHYKSQYDTADKLIKHFQRGLNHFFELKKVFPENCMILNFGSGFSIPYFENDQAMQLDVIKEKLQLLLKSYPVDYVKIQFESGRYITAQSGYYCCKILYTKKINDRNILVVDGGMYHFMAATGMGQLIRKHFPISVIHKNNSSKINTRYTIIGNTCSELDIFADEIILPEVQAGDWIVIENAGAYSLQYSPNHFILHKSALEFFEIEDN